MTEEVLSMDQPYSRSAEARREGVSKGMDVELPSFGVEAGDLGARERTVEELHRGDRAPDPGPSSRIQKDVIAALARPSQDGLVQLRERLKPARLRASIRVHEPQPNEKPQYNWYSSFSGTTGFVPSSALATGFPACASFTVNGSVFLR